MQLFWDFPLATEIKEIHILQFHQNYLKKIDLSESAINVLLAGEVGSVVVDQVLLLHCPEITLASVILHQHLNQSLISVRIIGCAKTIIFILFVAIISDWRAPWGKLMGTPPRLLHKVLHHVKRHAGGLPDQILLYRHFWPLHQPLIAINSNFVIVVIAWSEGCLYATGPTQTYSFQGGTVNRNKK